MTLASGDCNTDILARRSTDIYYYQATSSATDCGYSCSGSEGHTKTFLVVEQQCTNNSNFFNGELAIINVYQEYKYCYRWIHQNFTECPFVITPIGEPNELRLNVYTVPVKWDSRIQITTASGKESVTNATIVTKSTNESLNNSVSNLTEYMGELYRMNFSCNSSDRILPTHGCLFFKVYGDTTITDGTSCNSIIGSSLKW